MTISSRKIPLLFLLAVLPGLAFAQARPVKPAAAPAPRPRPVVVAPAPNQQWQRQVDRQQLENSQRQNALREQLRQGNMDRQRSNATDPALRSQLDNADSSQQQTYRARQDDAAHRYNTQPRPTRTTTVPATAGSAGR